MNVSQFHDSETRMQQRNLTTSQRRSNYLTKEGVVVNSFIKDSANTADCNLNDTYDSLVISRNAQMPKQLYDGVESKEKSLLPISTIAVGIMATITALTGFISKNAKNASIGIDELKKLPATTRNVALNEETHQAIYHMIQSTNKKTIIAGTGVLALTAMAFMGKTFFDGFRDVWVKKKEADIQKDLQEKLIDIETQSFSGKIQIIRSMMSEKAEEFSKYISDDNEKILPNFGKRVLGNNISFGAKKYKKENEENNLNYILLGIGTFVSIIGLGFIALKNLSKGKLHIDNRISATKDTINKIIKTATTDSLKTDKITLTKLFDSINASENDIKKAFEHFTGTPEEKQALQKYVLESVKRSTTKVDSAMGGDGTPKPTFYSHVDDYRAFFYNYLLDTENPYFKQLFFGITGLTAISYGGKLAGEAIRDVQVKRINANTEADLQQRLVATELRNFKSKKDASIKPLVKEFYKQVDNGKPKEELKIMADNILFEIKNGAPFVYS